MRDFQLQNCLTEEFESIHDIASDVKALMLVLTAGWCSACRSYIPQVINYNRPFAESDLKTMFILGEDASSGQPSLQYCRTYASSYGEDGGRFYIDHDGDYGFMTTFQHIWPYLGPNGEFGLPWKGVLSGGMSNYIYEYGDGATSSNDPTSAIQRLTQ